MLKMVHLMNELYVLDENMLLVYLHLKILFDVHVEMNVVV